MQGTIISLLLVLVQTTVLRLGKTLESIRLLTLHFLQLIKSIIEITHFLLIHMKGKQNADQYF